MMSNNLVRHKYYCECGYEVSPSESRCKKCETKRQNWIAELKVRCQLPVGGQSSPNEDKLNEWTPPFKGCPCRLDGRKPLVVEEPNPSQENAVRAMEEAME